MNRDEIQRYLNNENKQRMKKVESFVKKESDNYRKQVEKIKAKKVDLDKMEKLFRGHVQNCKDFASAIGISMSENYQLYCYLSDAADKAMQDVDDNLFGCFSNGKCVGYRFC